MRFRNSLCRAVLVLLAANGCGRLDYLVHWRDGGVPGVDATTDSGDLDAEIPNDDADQRDGSVDAGFVDVGIVDAGSVDAGLVDPRTLPPFGTATRIAELSSASVDDDPTLTADMREIYFTSGRTLCGGGEDILFSTRPSTADPWGTPRCADELNSLAAESAPEISADGLTLHFASARAGTQLDIYRSTRSSRTDPWSMPEPVPELNTTFNESAPMAATPTLLFLHSDRMSSITHIFRSTRATELDPWSTPARVNELTIGHEEAPFVDPTGQFVFFGGKVMLADFNDIYFASRDSTADPFGAPVVLPDLSSAEGDSDPWLSPDFRTIYFTRRQAGTGDDIFVATR